MSEIYWTLINIYDPYDANGETKFDIIHNFDQLMKTRKEFSKWLWASAGSVSHMQTVMKRAYANNKFSGKQRKEIFNIISNKENKESKEYKKFSNSWYANPFNGDKTGKASSVMIDFGHEQFAVKHIFYNNNNINTTFQ